MIGDDEGFYTEHLVLPASHTLLHLLIPRLQSVEHSGRFEPPGTRLHKLQSPQVSLQSNPLKYWQESIVLAAVNAPLKLKYNVGFNTYFEILIYTLQCYTYASIEADKSEIGEMNSKHLAWPALQVLVHASMPLTQ